MIQDRTPRTLRSLSKTIALVAITTVLSLMGLGVADAASVVGSNSPDELYPFTIEAHADQNPPGTIFFQMLIGTIKGTVTNMCVSGNTAVIVGTITENTTNQVGPGFELYVVDNQVTTSGQMIDLFRIAVVGWVPSSCPLFQILPATGVNAQDIVVTDDSVRAYSCTGFLSPADVDIALKANVDRAIPLQMVLMNGAVPVTGSSPAGIDPPVVSVSYQSAQGQAWDVTSLLEPVGRSSDGNEFGYDAKTELWVFNLGTKAYNSAGTYTVTAESGNSHVYRLSPTCVAHFVRSN